MIWNKRNGNNLLECSFAKISRKLTPLAIISTFWLRLVLQNKCISKKILGGNEHPSSTTCLCHSPYLPRFSSLRNPFLLQRDSHFSVTIPFLSFMWSESILLRLSKLDIICDSWSTIALEKEKIICPNYSLGSRINAVRKLFTCLYALTCFFDYGRFLAQMYAAFEF